MAIRFFFSDSKKELIQLPVNPEEISITKEGDNKTVTTLGLGEINLIGKGKLSTVEFEGFLPVDSDSPFVLTKGRFKAPQYYIDFFNRVLDNSETVRFIISDSKVNDIYTVESFEYKMIAGTDDFGYSIELKQYRVYNAKTVKVTNSSSGGSKKVAPPPKVTRPKGGFVVGDNVITNGTYWETSYGEGRHGTFNNFSGKISHIVADTKRKYRFHITNPNGDWYGWVHESQIKRR